jgi:molybdate transport system substrate-binding protein
MKKSILIVIAICMAFLMVACTTSQNAAEVSQSEAVSSEPAATQSVEPEASAETETSSEPVELTIAAAASLTDVTAEIADAYKQVAPDVQLTFTYASSGNLQTQIEEGAPVDIFMSAAQKQMNALEEEGLLADGTRSDLLENKVVLIMPADSDMALTSFEDLATDMVSSVALGDPESVPAGQYAEEVLTSLDILDTVKEKANYGSDVRQVLTWVESGNVDCGVVYATDAATSENVKVVCEAPEGSVKAIIYPVSVLEQSASKDAAMSFIEFMKTDDAAAIFEKYGFKMASDA